MTGFKARNMVYSRAPGTQRTERTICWSLELSIEADELKISPNPNNYRSIKTLMVSIGFRGMSKNKLHSWI